MKNILLLSILGILFVNLGEESLAVRTYSTDALDVTCIEGNRVCAVGKYLFSTNGKPLSIQDGMVCTSDKRVCATEYFSIITNKTKYGK